MPIRTVIHEYSATLTYQIIDARRLFLIHDFLCSVCSKFLCSVMYSPCRLFPQCRLFGSWEYAIFFCNVYGSLGQILRNSTVLCAQDGGVFAKKSKRNQTNNSLCISMPLNCVWLKRYTRKSPPGFRTKGKVCRQQRLEAAVAKIIKH